MEAEIGRTTSQLYSADTARRALFCTVALGAKGPNRDHHGPTADSVPAVYTNTEDLQIAAPLAKKVKGEATATTLDRRTMLKISLNISVQHVSVLLYRHFAM